MKSPNPSNIDQWLFHYFEGDLSSNEESLLEDFLLENPQYDAHFEAWGAARINNPQLDYVNKGALLKPLVAPALLNKITVFTALGVNAILAAFIILNNRPLSQDLAKAAYHGMLPNLIETSNALDVERQLDARTLDVIAPAPTYMSDENTSRNFVSSAAYKNQAPILASANSVIHTTESPEGYALVNGTPQAFNAHVTGDFSESLMQLDFSEQEIFEGTPNSIEIEPLASNHSAESHPTFSENLNISGVQDASASSTQANSGSSRAKSDSESRDRKSNKLSNRFKNGGELMLTNSRDVEYLVPGMNRNQINFGHVASDFSNSVYSNTYMQWPNQSSAMLSNQLGLDIYLPEAKSGLGLQLLYDRYANGAINNLEFSATYSPKLFLNRTRSLVLEPALRLRMGGTGVDRSQLTPGSLIEFDRSNAFIYTNTQHNSQVNRSVGQDFGLGVLLNTKWGFVGANADNFLGTRNFALHYGAEQFVDRTPIFFNAVLGTEYESRNRKVKMSGQIVYQNFGELNKFWFGSRVKYNSLSLGASVSSAGEPMLSAGWVSRQISILYSTDYALSQMSGRKHLSHQLTMRVTLKESRIRKLMLN